MRWFSLALVAMAAVACLGAVAGVKVELPDWFVVALGAVLPWVFATFIARLPGWLRPVVTYGAAAVVAVAAGFLFAGWRSIGDVLANLAWLFAVLQFVYDLMVRPTRRLLAERSSRLAERARDQVKAQ